MHNRKRMNTFFIRTFLLLFMLQSISCSEEISLVPEEAEAQASTVMELKLWAKYLDGSPLSDVAFSLTAFPEAEGETLVTTGISDQEGVFVVYLDVTQEWSYVEISTSDERFVGKVRLELPKNTYSISHTWVARSN